MSDPWWKQSPDALKGLGNPKPEVTNAGALAGPPAAKSTRVIELDKWNVRSLAISSPVPFAVAIVGLSSATADANGVAASQMLLPTLDDLAARTVGALAVGVLPLERMDAGLRKEISGITSIPTLVVFQLGAELGRVVGAEPVDQLIGHLATFVPTLAPSAPTPDTVARPPASHAVAASNAASALGPTAGTNDFQVIPASQLPTFKDLGGLDDVKRQLDQSVGAVLRSPALAQQLHVSFNGVLLYGPPGSGKTYLAQAMAGEYRCNFVSVGSSQLISPFAGESSRRIAAAFTFAASKAPVVLFFDEFDSIGQRRDNNPNADRQVIEELLRGLESIRNSPNVIVVAATNAIDALDPAVTRQGRFDLKVRIDLPDAAARAAIFRAQLKGRPVDPAIDYGALSTVSEGRSAAAITAAINRAALSVLNDRAAGGRARVITDADLRAAFASVGGKDRPLATAWKWDDLVLPAATKQQLQQLQALVQDPSRAKSFGITPPSGALLYGPPGTGKTTIAKVLAAQANTSFYPVTASDLLSKWVGDSEQNVAQLFARARENAPSIIFIDEIDSIAARRGATMDSGVSDRILNQLLLEIDGLGARPGVFVVGATNRMDLLDEAILRGGRLEAHIEIGLPDESGRLALLQLFTKTMPLGADVLLPPLVAPTVGMSPADIRQLCQAAGLRAMSRVTPGGSSAVLAADFNAALAAGGRQPLTTATPVRWW